MIITMITVMLRQFIVFDTGGLASSLLFTPGLAHLLYSQNIDI